MNVKGNNLNKPHNSVITYILCYAQFYMRINLTKQELTGKWFLKKCFFGYYIMVEIKITNPAPLCDQPRELIVYKKAKPQHIIELGIKCA